MRRIIAILLPILCFSLWGDIPLFAGQYVYSHFSTESGLPSNHIHDIAQDKKGFIWIATHYGVSKFNGKSFHNYLSVEYPSMFRDDMYHSFLMKDGTLGFGSSKGTLVAYADHRDDFVDLAQGLDFYCDVTGYTQSEDGEELISTTNGVFSYVSQNKRLEPMNVVPVGTPTYEICKDAFQHYWVGVSHGVGVFSKDGARLSGFEMLETIGEQINNICQLDAHTLWLCASTGSLWQVSLEKDGQLKQLKKMDTPFKNISEICVDGATVWIGTAGAGLWKSLCVNGEWTFERCMPINRDDSDVRKISALFRDADGNIWVGTQNSGLWCISHVMKESVSFSNDLGIPMVTGTSFGENERGELLMGTDGQGLYVLDSLFNVKKHLTESDGLSSNNVLSLQPANGACVVSYWGGPVSKINPNTFQNERLTYKGIDKPLFNAKYAGVFNDVVWTCLSGDGVYLGAASGEWRRLELPLIGGTTDRWVNHVCFAPDGTAWVATTRTIWHIDRNGKAKSVFADVESTPNHKPTELHQCAVDLNGNCFAATSNGVYCCEAGADSFSQLGFLPKGIYNSVFVDTDGTIWTSGTNGVVSFSLAEKTYVTEIDGLESYDRDFFIPRAVYKDQRNRLLFGTKQGFVVMNTAVKAACAQPYVEWSDLYLRGAKVKSGESELLSEALSFTKELNLAYDQTDFSLKFDVVNLQLRNVITAYYQIGGLDTSWVPVGNDETIGITQLPPGNYDLQVRFFCKGLEIPNVGLHMGLHVSPPWWRTWWFYSLCTLLVVASVLFYFFQRIRNITRQKVELEQKVNERTQELKDANLSLQQREKEVELQNDMLHSALKDKDQLVSIVAHDLKNPMFSIVGSLADLLRDEKEKDNATLRQIYHASSVLQGQMLKLLDWATENRITATCDYQHVDLQEIVSEVVALTHGILTDKKIRLTTDIRLTHCVYADPRMLSTIVRNLLTNAAKFTESGKGITIGAHEIEEGKTRFFVKDEGVGMSDETIGNLMANRRSTTKGTASEQGYGIGFGIIQEFVKLNNGQLKIESELGKGTNIWVDFVRSEKVLEKKNASKKENQVSIEIDRNLLEGKTILVVDDDPLILLHLKSLLSQYVNVLTADNGEDGLQMAKNVIPDLVLSDVDMPKMSGMEMFDAIRANSLTSNIPVLFISAINEESLRLRGLSSGAIDYIPKPFNEQELLLKACNVLSVLKRQQLSVLMDAMQGEVEQPEEVNPLLGQLLDVVKEHYMDAGYSFDDMASALGLSKSTLVRRLKSLTDKSPVEILSDYRLNKAKQLLLSGSSTVSDVAYAVGFNDPLYFSRKFKEAFGCPPSKIK